MNGRAVLEASAHAAPRSVTQSVRRRCSRPTRRDDGCGLIGARAPLDALATHRTVQSFGRICPLCEKSRGCLLRQVLACQLKEAAKKSGTFRNDLLA